MSQTNQQNVLDDKDEVKEKDEVKDEVKDTTFFSAYDNQDNEERFIVNYQIDKLSSENTENADMHYITKMLVRFGDEYCIVDTGGIGKKVDVLYSSNNDIFKITDVDHSAEDTYYKFCSDCDHKTKFTKLLTRHRRKTRHNRFPNVYNELSIKIAAEKRSYVMIISNMGGSNVDINQKNIRIKITHNTHNTRNANSSKNRCPIIVYEDKPSIHNIPNLLGV
jgi:hypothetical protein